MSEFLLRYSFGLVVNLFAIGLFATLFLGGTRLIAMKLKLSGVIAAAAWASTLLMVWLLFTGTVEFSTGRFALVMLVLLIACASSMIYDGGKVVREEETKDQ